MYVEEVRWDSRNIAVKLKTLRKIPITRKPTKNVKYLHVLETLNDFTAVESELKQIFVRARCFITIYTFQWSNCNSQNRR
ncbi:hypothetical protein V1527DRAFT_458159 [Lipomyces starkeyi]